MFLNLSKDFSKISILIGRMLKIRLANETSVYTAELSAIFQALLLIEKEPEDQSDSLSSLQAIETMYPT
jgi:hypothetical protein